MPFFGITLLKALNASKFGVSYLFPLLLLLFNFLLDMGDFLRLSLLRAEAEDVLLCPILSDWIFGALLVGYWLSFERDFAPINKGTFYLVFFWDFWLLEIYGDWEILDFELFPRAEVCFDPDLCIFLAFILDFNPLISSCILIISFTFMSIETLDNAAKFNWFYIFSTSSSSSSKKSWTAWSPFSII